MVKWHVTIGICPVCGNGWFADAVVRWPVPKEVKDRLVECWTLFMRPKIDRHMEVHADELVAAIEEGELDCD